MNMDKEVEPQKAELQEEVNYPSVAERAKAASIDGIILIVIMALINGLFSQFDEIPVFLSVASFLFVFVLYDPMLTTFSGGTIGHKSMGIRVRQVQNEKKNINFFSALFRFLVKALLGWISLLMVNFNAKKLAIHDRVASSVVVYK